MRAMTAVALAGVTSVAALSLTGLSLVGQTRPATPPAATPTSKSLTVSGGAVSNLAPGSGARDLAVLVANPNRNTGVVAVQRVTVTVDPVRSRLSTGCVVTVDPLSVTARNAADIVITSYDAARPGAPAILLTRDSQPYPVPLTIEMRNRSARQDSCKAARLQLDYVATAAGR